jgi:hypothetical protein
VRAGVPKFFHSSIHSLCCVLVLAAGGDCIPGDFGLMHAAEDLLLHQVQVELDAVFIRRRHSLC